MRCSLKGVGWGTEATEDLDRDPFDLLCDSRHTDILPFRALGCVDNPYSHAVLEGKDPAHGSERPGCSLYSTLDTSFNFPKP